MVKTRFKLNMWYEGAKISALYCFDIFHALITAIFYYYEYHVKENKKFMCEIYFLDKLIFDIHPSLEPDDLLIKFLEYLIELSND